MSNAQTLREARDLWSLQRLLALVGTLVVFVVLSRGLDRIADLPAGAFHQPVLFIETIRHLPRLGWMILPLILYGTLLFCKRRQALAKWQDWHDAVLAQGLVIAAAAALAWPYATYDFNCLLDRWHWADRAFLLLSWAGVCWRPIFVFPFLLILLPIVAQAEPPLGDFSRAIPDLAIHVLILFASSHVVLLCTGRKRMRSFLYLTCCLVAAHYWASGYSKLRLGWLLHDRIEFLLPNAYANGWLAFLAPETIVQWTKVLDATGPVFKVFTLLVECGCILLLWRRRLSIVLLLCWILFHVGVFLVTGICLWQWVVLETFLLVLVWRAQAFQTRTIYWRGGMLLAIAIIGTSHWWLNPVPLTWFDARATYNYRFYGVGLTGQRYHLPPRFFAPYDYQFTVGRFHYLAPEPVLGISWGATSREIADRLLNARTAEDVLALEKELGVSFYNPERRDIFAAFIREFVAGLNTDPARKTRLRMIQAPRDLWTFGGMDAYRYQEPISKVEVVQTLSFFDGAKFTEIRRRPVLAIEIPSQSANARSMNQAIATIPAAAEPIRRTTIW